MAGKLDTGADVTVIPAEIPDGLGLSPWGWTRVTGFDGSSSTRLIYYVDMQIEGLRLSGVRCIASNRAGILLGRNVLNHFLITLDGKNLAFDMQAP